MSNIEIIKFNENNSIIYYKNINGNMTKIII